VGRNPLPFLLVFLLGGLFAFVYSYAPLHSAQSWKIDYLEKRLADRNERLKAIETELSIARSDAASRPDADEFKSVSSELTQAQRELRKLRSETQRQAATIESLRKSRNDWRAKVTKLEAEAREREAQRRAPAPRESLDGPAFDLPGGGDEPLQPAAPAPEPFEQ
jgi:septal ring factor EnvC (AmiA/AmiB activator)